MRTVEIEMMSTCSEDSPSITDESRRLLNKKANEKSTSFGTTLKDFLKKSFCKCFEEPEAKDRTIFFGKLLSHDVHKPNIICNQKYNIFTFLPLVLIEQFSMFTNLYFLLLSISQFIPALQISELYTYWAPLGFIMSITLIREAIDEVRRWKRDRELNGTEYKVLRSTGRIEIIRSSDIQVGDILILERQQRVPADVAILRVDDKSASCFIKTDQLDGETDWKVKLSLPFTQMLSSDDEIFDHNLSLYCQKPEKDIHNFYGIFNSDALVSNNESQLSVSLDNCIWASCVLASSAPVTALVMYTGKETRSVLNTSRPHAKVGKLDIEANNYSKVLFIMCLVLSILLVAMKQFSGTWFTYILRYIVLFSSVIPISLRVNLDMSKMWHSYIMIQRDKLIPDTTARNSTIPEQLARVEVLLSDKTGTLTQNVMTFKKLHLGSYSFGSEEMPEVHSHLHAFFRAASTTDGAKHSIDHLVGNAVMAIACCHNVTPVIDDGVDTSTADLSTASINYQASSPDEVALVEWTQTVGLTLIRRDLNSMELLLPDGRKKSFHILQLFPFTSETKRMGIIVKEDVDEGRIVFYMKGADVVMAPIVQYADWLEEECGNMAREGLRTLVVGRRVLTAQQYADFDKRYASAKLAGDGRHERMRAALDTIEADLELLALTGVEDKLQLDVRPTLEAIKNAGIKVWMLTGDKMETAACVAKSSRLVARNGVHYFREVATRDEAHQQMNALRRVGDKTVVIAGRSVQVCVEHYESEFVDLAYRCPSVVVCRCSPTMKEEIVRLVKQHKDKVVAAIGDGGNDVSMIQAADVGLGITGKEGMQAALAADFSLTQFSHMTRLFFVHGRNSYKSAASLTIFIFHRGLIITAMTIILCSFFYLTPILLFPGFLMVGYSTAFTMFPIFSLVLDQDVPPETALTYPELYKDLVKGRDLSMKRFFVWCFISIYQAVAIMLLGILILFQQDTILLYQVTFTALISVELIMVGMVVRTWHWAMIASEFMSLVSYVLTVAIFHNQFDVAFFGSVDFWWKFSLMVGVSCIPLFLVKCLRQRFSPTVSARLQGN